MPSLKDQAIRGVFWSAIQNWGSAALGAAVFVILANLLAAEQFGLIALAAVVISFMEIFLRQGFGAAIIQRKDLEPAHLHTAFWANLAASLVLMGLAIATADLAAAAFDEPGLAPVIRWLSLGLPIGALNGTPGAILKREMAFKTLAVRSLLGVTGGGIVGVSMALSGYGVWSLVAQHLTAAAVGTVVLWTATGFRPRFTVSTRHFRDLFAFGVHILGGEILGFFNQRLDRVLIGLFLGTTAVGYYHVAQRLLNLMTQVLTKSVSAVSFSTFSKLQHDLAQMRSAFYTASQITAAVAVPAFLGLAVLAPELVAALFGEGWEPSIPVMRVLAFIGILQSVTPFNGIVMLACGKPHWRLAIMLLHTTVNVVAFFVVVRWGIVAVAAAFVLRGYLLTPIPILVLKRLIGLNARAYLERFRVPLLGSLVMVAVVAASKYLLGDLAGIHLTLAIAIIVGIASYTLAVQRLAPDLTRQMRDFAGSALRARRASAYA